MIKFVCKWNYITIKKQVKYFFDIISDKYKKDVQKNVFKDFCYFVISFIEPKLARVFVASNGINTLFASPLEISSNASRAFN